LVRMDSGPARGSRNRPQAAPQAARKKKAPQPKPGLSRLPSAPFPCYPAPYLERWGTP